MSDAEIIEHKREEEERLDTAEDPNDEVRDLGWAVCLCPLLPLTRCITAVLLLRQHGAMQDH